MTDKNNEQPDEFDPSGTFPYENLDQDDNGIPRKTIKSRLWSLTKLVLKITVTVLLLRYVLSKINLDEVKILIAHSNPWWMVAALITYFISIVISSFRLLSFFKSIDLHIGWKFNLRLYMLGIFYNLCLPGGIGGDGYKIYLLNKRYKQPAKKVFWAILFDRLSGFWAIGFITVVLIVFLPQLKIPLVLAWSVFLAGTAIYYFVAHKFFKDYTNNFWEAHAKAIVVQGFQVLTILLVMIGLNHDGKFAPYLSAFLASSMAAVVPFSIGGLGFREFIFKYVITELFHSNGELAVVLSLSFYVISAIIALLGVYYVFRDDKLAE
ncbi:lysylphosphatidylglycerol synthase transmembrane domain-containing protein [Mucilaginibacter puniceus]